METYTGKSGDDDWKVRFKAGNLSHIIQQHTVLWLEWCRIIVKCNSRKNVIIVTKKVASEMHCNVKAAWRRAIRTALLFDKFVLRMHRKCYFRAIGQNSDTTDGFGNPDFLYGTYILAIGGYLTCDPLTLNMMVRQISASTRQNSSVLLLSASIKERLHPKSATKNATKRVPKLNDGNMVVNKSN